MAINKPSATASDVDAAAILVATLAAPTNGAAWIVTGLEITGCSATTGTAVAATLTGLSGGTLDIAVAVGALATPAPPIIMKWDNGLQGLPNTAIVLTVASFGSGNAKAAAAVHAVLSN